MGLYKNILLRNTYAKKTMDLVCRKLRPEDGTFEKQLRHRRPEVVTASEQRGCKSEGSTCSVDGECCGNEGTVIDAAKKWKKAAKNFVGLPTTDADHLKGWCVGTVHYPHETAWKNVQKEKGEKNLVC